MRLLLVFKLRLKYNPDYWLDTARSKSNANIRKMDMMIQRLVVVLLVVALVGLVRAEDAEEVVVASAEELN